MQFLNSLLLTSSYVLFIISFIPHCQVLCDEEKDADLCFVKDREGKDKVCYFGFVTNGDADIYNMVVFVENANIGNHRKNDFSTHKEAVLLNHTRTMVCGLPSVMPENGQNVEGMTYLFTEKVFTKEFVPLLAEDVDGRKVKRLVQFPLEVTEDDRKETITCNALVAINNC